MSEKQFKIINELGDYHLLDGDEELCYDLCSPAMAKENWGNVVEKLNELNTEREYLIGERGKLETKNVLLRKENEQLKEELQRFKKYVFSQDNILCYKCEHCIKKDIYVVDCEMKGEVDVHGLCGWFREVKV